MKMSQILNQFVVGLLESPLHFFISKSMLVLSIEGRKSGKLYRVPVEYVEHNDEYLVISQSDRTWWRNLTLGQSAIAMLRGRQIVVSATVITKDIEAFKQAMAIYLNQYPKRGRFFGLVADASGIIPESDWQQAATERVLIWLSL